MDLKPHQVRAQDQPRPGTTLTSTSTSTSTSTLTLRSKLAQPSSDSPRTTAASQRRFGGLFASLGLGASGTGSPLRPFAGPAPGALPSGQGGVGRVDAQSRLQKEGLGGDERTSTSNSTGTSTSTPKKAHAAGGIRSFAERMAQLTLLTPTPLKGGRKTEWPEEYEAGGSAEGIESGIGSGIGIGIGLEKLPDEILLAIALHLPPTIAQLHTLALLNRRWYDISRTPVLWLRILREAGYELAELGERGVAVEYPPLGRWEGLQWVDGDTEGGSQGDSGGNEDDGASDDEAHREGVDAQSGTSSRCATDYGGPLDLQSQPSASSARIPTPIHYPTLVQSRLTLSRRIRSSVYQPVQTLLQAHGDAVYCARSAGGYVFTGSRDRSIRLWDLGPFGVPGHVQLSPSRSPSSTSEESDEESPMREREIVKSAPLSVVNDAHERSVLQLDVDIDAAGKGVLVSASSDSTVRVWAVDLSQLGRAHPPGDDNDTKSVDEEESSGDRTNQPSVIRKLSTLSHTSSVMHVTLAARHIISASKDHKIRVYDRTTYELVRVLEGHMGPVNSLALRLPATATARGPNRHVGHGHGQSRSASGRESQRDAPELGRVAHPSMSTPPAPAQIISASGDGTWIIWDYDTGIKVRQGGEGGTGNGLACVVWQGDHIVACGNDERVTLYDASTGEVVRTFTGHTDMVRSVALHLEEGIIVSASYDRTIRMWDLHTGQCLRTINQTREWIVFDLELDTNRMIAARQDGCLQTVSFGEGLPYSALFV